MARRILLTIEYDGTAYSGWQRQYNGLAVQQLIEEALTRATGETITITGASRTDAGVHALGQCAHFDTSSRIPPEKYPFVLNTMLPRDIRVQAGRKVPDGFGHPKRFLRVVDFRQLQAVRRRGHAQRQAVKRPERLGEGIRTAPMQADFDERTGNDAHHII